MLNGKGAIEVGGATKIIQAGDTVLVPSNTPHQIGNPADSAETLETLVICVPAWEPSNTVWLDAATKVVQSPDEARALIDPASWVSISARRRAHADDAATSPPGENQRGGLLTAMSLVAAAAAGLAVGLRIGRQSLRS